MTAPGLQCAVAARCVPREARAGVRDEHCALCRRLVRLPARPPSDLCLSRRGCTKKCHPPAFMHARHRERGVNEALLEAIRHSHVADVRWCLDHGADVNRAARYGETPLHPRVQNGPHRRSRGGAAAPRPWRRNRPCRRAPSIAIPGRVSGEQDRHGDAPSRPRRIR